MSGPFFLRNDAAAESTMKALGRTLRTLLTEWKGIKVTLTEIKSKRTLEQNDKFHAMCGDIAKKTQWAKQWIDGEGWKRLLVDAWARSTDRTQGRIVPSLDGQSVVNLGIQTRSMPVEDMSELIEFAYSWCSDNEVELNEPRPEPCST